MAFGEEEAGSHSHLELVERRKFLLPPRIEPGLQKRTYQFTNRFILVRKNIQVNCLSFWDSDIEGHVTNVTVT
jgi:hypothetical protein